MKYLITGANGYLGQGVVKALLDNGQEVIATDFSTENVDIRARKIESNVFNSENPMDEFGYPDILVHMAWRDGFQHFSSAHFEDLPKHIEFLEKMTAAGIKKVVIMGSMHEIGFFEGSIDEFTSCNPMNYYGIAKNALREAAQIICRKHDVLFQWLRAYYIVGNSRFGSSIFSKITEAVMAGKKEFPFTMGQNQYDFLDYDLFCEYIARTVIQDNVDGVINICKGYPEKLADRVERFIEENNYDIKLKYGAFPDRPYDAKAVWGNDRKLKMILGDC